GLLMFRALILESRVDWGMPSLAAAPRGPDTLPLLSASADSIISRSWAASFSEKGRIAESGVREGPANQLSSMQRFSESEMITDRSITFCNSRIFPGHL